MTIPKSPPDCSIVSRETMEEARSLIDENRDIFSRLQDLWLWWNKSVNLFSRKCGNTELYYHIWHSLLLSCHNPSGFIDDSNIIVDAGTGGGLPGIPMAVACPDKQFLLVDKVRKKQRVIKDISTKLGLSNITAVHDKIENVRPNNKFRVVSKHAFDAADLLSSLGIAPESVMMLKGKDVFEELDKVDEEQVSAIRIDEIDASFGSFFKDKYIVTFQLIMPQSAHGK
ncbi:16S rRNA (guanine(527)-N(7))-methyltransferase RsmG [Natronogracilivirga saccharolytica]|uniref:Ribosomal RNA small subunit methyltransferase G n=1 Tax=Natronogracilivirga saccharolytica TaxID=2812953 RepID=A0A8J7RIY9_9BACT|nr:RsmG family class I SAM-dependent methyltransferase [Natronogracilivirga saccharolytica]MBP3191565.1 class I SAM-dependent methyltransferase [Natronogracilivirga saccharolytica]